MSNSVQSIPANWYYDGEIYQREQKKIFEKNWTFIAQCTDVASPGQFVTSTIANQPVVIVRTSHGNLKGFLNLCRHRASMLCTKTSGIVPQFTCPYHAWSYDLDGVLKNAPGFEIGKDVDTENFSLIPIEVDTWNGMVFACLDKSCISLADWLGDILNLSGRFPGVAEMDFEAMRSNDSDINWKNYSDNSAEGYHLSTIHPALKASLVSNQTRIKPFENGKFVGFDVTYKDADKNGSPGYWIYKFPGLLLHFSMNSFNIERVIPVSPNRTIMQRWFWFMPFIGNEERQQTIDFSNQVMDEDVGICTRVQQNLEGGVYQTGLLSREREPGTIYFQQCVKESLEA
jgi:choline monooxygenase